MREVEVCYVLDLESYADSVAPQVSRLRGRLLAIVGLMALAAVVGRIGAPAPGYEWELALLAVAIFAGMVYSLVRFSLRRQFARRPDRDCQVRYRFTTGGLHSEVEGLARSERAWALVQRVVEQERGFQLYQNAQVYEWLPRHGFDGPDEIDAFKQLVEAIDVEHSWR